MFAEVILQRRVPSRFESFTYEVPDEMKILIGQIVRVPFKKQKLSAVVRNLHKTQPPYPTKKIDAAMPIFIQQWQMELAQWMAEFYKAPFSKALNLFLPPSEMQMSLRGALATKQSGAERRPERSEGSRLLRCARNDSFSQLTLLSIELLKSSTPTLLIEKTPLNRREFYAALRNALPIKKQLLILVPEVFHAEHLAGNWPVFHGGLKEKERNILWHAVYKNKYDAIVGTRAALWLPYQNLGAIVVDFEHSESYYEKREPRYHALEIAEKMAELLKIPLIAISASPRVETYWNKKYGKKIYEDKKAIPISIIDMADEKRKGITGIFAQASLEKIAACLAAKKQILLFINRKGEASALLCTDCSSVFRCDQCNGPFTVHHEKILLCHRCKITKEIPIVCTRCGGAKLKMLGFGNEKVEKEIKKIFEGAKILRLDKDVFKETQSRHGLMNALKDKMQKTDIIISTRLIDKPLDLPRLSLSIVMMPDPLLNLPDFRANERLLQLLISIRHLTHGEIVIQTFLPEHPIFHFLCKNDLEGFYKDELEIRKSLSLPPFQKQ